MHSAEKRWGSCRPPLLFSLCRSHGSGTKVHSDTVKLVEYTTSLQPLEIPNRNEVVQGESPGMKDAQQTGFTLSPTPRSFRSFALYQIILFSVPNLCIPAHTNAHAYCICSHTHTERMQLPIAGADMMTLCPPPCT